VKTGSAQAELYAAEHAVLDDLGVCWDRVSDAQADLDRLVDSAWFGERWPHFVRCTVERRCRGARWSCCQPLDAAGPDGAPTEGVILVADGGLRQPVILHELAHLLCGEAAGHGVVFARTHLELVRHEMGFFAYADYLHDLSRRPGFTGLTTAADASRGTPTCPPGRRPPWR
jgi:putative metallohydrolase (TIGR04338 family)